MKRNRKDVIHKVIQLLFIVKEYIFKSAKDLEVNVKAFEAEISLSIGSGSWGKWRYWRVLGLEPQVLQPP